MRDGMTRPTDLTDAALERALVALIFVDNANLDLLGPLTPDDLVDPYLGAILAAALNAHEDGIPVTPVTLKPRLEGIRLEDDRNGLDLLRSLGFAGTLPAMAEVVARLHALATRRRMIAYHQGLIEAMRDESQSMAALATDSLARTADFLTTVNGVERTDFRLKEAADDFLAWIERGGDPIEISTGLDTLDEATGGWHRGQFGILAGRPSMGKTALALASMLRTARRAKWAIERNEPFDQRTGVLFFSLEMTKWQVISRALSDWSYTDPKIPYFDMRPGRVTEPQMRRLREAANRLQDMPMIVEPLNGLTIADIAARTRKAKQEFADQGIDLALVCVDHLLKVRPTNRYKGNAVKELDEVSEGMCVLAKTQNVAALGVHQLNRGVEGRDNKRPLMSDLRGSGALEQDADVILFPYRPAYAIERQIEEGVEDRVAADEALRAVQNQLEVQIAKQRNGPTQLLKFWCDMSVNVVRDLERRGNA